MTTIVLPRGNDTGTPVKNPGQPGVASHVGVRYVDYGNPSSTGSVRQIANPSRREFRNLADWWHEATDALSSPDEKVDHVAYQRIMRSGDQMLRYILEDLRDHGGHWFVALEEITKMGPPIPAGVTPSLRAERDAWLSWGKASGILD